MAMLDLFFWVRFSVFSLGIMAMLDIFSWVCLSFFFSWDNAGQGSVSLSSMYNVILIEGSTGWGLVSFSFFQAFGGMALGYGQYFKSILYIFVEHCRKDR